MTVDVCRFNAGITSAAAPEVAILEQIPMTKEDQQLVVFRRKLIVTLGVAAALTTEGRAEHLRYRIQAAQWLT